MRHQNTSFSERLGRAAQRRAHVLWIWARGPGRHIASVYGLSAARRIRSNLAARRLLSFPHMLVLFWIIVLLWGERWVFGSKVEKCEWQNWERWPKGTKPHHLIMVADPQIIDPHSYPGRPWPLSSLTVTITDNYLRRGYGELTSQLQPDSLFFLGDLFDGGREWKTRQGQFVDPKWGQERAEDEKGWVKTWHRKYGEDFWVREYKRFGDIFFNGWRAAGEVPGPYQRGKKLVASLPGNHDLGFGAQIQVPVRDRFSAFFGDVNRVDIVGNHSIVSVDAVSLSADTSQFKDSHDLKPIYGPVNEFLDGVQSTKRKLAQDELQVWYGRDPERDFRFGHVVEELDTADVTRVPRDPGPGAADFPTILLTHVPLYRPPGTPCGPARDHWPPAKVPKGQTGPVTPDERNAITVVGGYQYQNVLSEEDSVKLVKKVGNIVQVFSGDDHDYCEIVHSDAKENVKEITVKSLSMAMGVPNPGFVMVSLYNPVDAHGKPLPGAPKQTLQTHLCLLPNQIHTYMTYISLFVLTLALLAVRALLVPVLRLTPFALEPEQGVAILPVFKDKAEPPVTRRGSATYSGTSGSHLSSRTSTLGARSSSAAGVGNGGARWAAKKSRQSQRWAWGAENHGPRISLENNFYDDGDKGWKSAKGRQAALGTVGREMWTTTWRVVWMAVLYWAYLTKRG